VEAGKCSDKLRLLNSSYAAPGTVRRIAMIGAKDGQGFGDEQHGHGRLDGEAVVGG